MNRDLSIVLDGNSEINKSILFTNGKTTIFLPAVDTAGSSKKDICTIPFSKDSIVAQNQNKSSITFSNFTLKHLCEHVDCNKPLFGK